MKLRLIAAASAALGALALASAASAAITVSTTYAPEKDNLFGDGSNTPVGNIYQTPLSTYGQQMLDDFDAILNPAVVYTGNVLQGPQTGSTSASPPYDLSVAGDTTKFASVQANQTGEFKTNTGYVLTSFSFYMGSPDSYNRISFYSNGQLLQKFDGKDIWNANVNGGTDTGDRTWGYRVFYDFGGATVDRITFDSFGSDAFEFDGLAGSIAGIPEPTSWAFMIMGFGGVGATLRSRRRAVAAA